MLSLAQTIKDIRAKLSAKADKTYVDSSVDKKLDKTGTAVKANSVPWSGVTDKPKSFAPTVTAEVPGTALTAGQGVRVNGAGALIANDMLKSVRAAGTSADVAKLAATPISMEEMLIPLVILTAKNKNRKI